MTRYILNAMGEPVPCDDLVTWSRWFETGNRIVEQTSIDDAVRVSTVFLGLDHNWGTGRPILWETLVFGGPLDGEMYRYRTRLEAVRGHNEMVDRCRHDPRHGQTRQIDLES